MEIEKRTILHMGDRNTKFAAAESFCVESFVETWNVFVLKCVAAYVGHPERAFVDQSMQFQIMEFAPSLSSARTDRKEAGVQSHKSLVKMERYHA